VRKLSVMCSFSYARLAAAALNRHNERAICIAAALSEGDESRSPRTSLKGRDIPSISQISPISDPMHPLVVATYNVHACVGVDRRYDPDRIAAVIRELDADIIALQEVSARDRRGTLIDEFAYLAKATGFDAVPGPCLIDRRGSFGNVLLTRRPVTAVRRIDLSIPGREPRGAIDVDVVIGGGDVRVIATHLGLRLAERRQQVEKLLKALDATPEESGVQSGGRPCILLGDLNEWRRRGGSLQPLKANLDPTPVSSTFPSWCPALPLDRIFASGVSAQSRPSVAVQVHRSRGARLASDHLPLRAVITWNAMGGVAAACPASAKSEAA
jgi:endonuclease/exonuclease/phosphatase family metal-dependent hydrolase